MAGDPVSQPSCHDWLLCKADEYRCGGAFRLPIVVAMNGSESGGRRRERALFETGRHVVVGDVTLPPEGYQSRFSDAINRGDLSFIPLTNVEITSIESGEVTRHDFVVLAKASIEVAYPLDAVN
ncbi:MAG: hypothetical protein ACM3N0_04295 [Chloroflexota bacterium]